MGLRTEKRQATPKKTVKNGPLAEIVYEAPLECQSLKPI
jgi:hypothetical protein